VYNFPAKEGPPKQFESAFAFVQIFIQKSTVQGGWGILQLLFLKAHSLYPINVKTKFSKTKGTTLCMSCTVKAVSGGRHAGRQAAGGDGLQCRLSA